MKVRKLASIDRTLLIACAFLACATSACADENPETLKVRLFVGADYVAGARPPKAPLLDIPADLLTEPPLPPAIRDLYEQRSGKVVEGRKVLGYVYLSLPPSLFDGEGASTEVLPLQISLLGSSWPSSQLALIDVAASSGVRPRFDSGLQLHVLDRGDVPPRSRKVFYTGGRDPMKDVTIDCKYFDREHADYRGQVDFCYMWISPVPNVLASLGFEPRDLPRWRGRAAKVRSLVESWALPYEDWPVNAPVENKGRVSD